MKGLIFLVIADSDPLDKLTELQSIEVYVNLTREERLIRHRILLEKEVPNLQRKLEIANLENKQLQRELEVRTIDQKIGQLYEQRNGVGLKILDIEKKRRKALEQTKEGWRPSKCDGECDLALYLFV